MRTNRSVIGKIFDVVRTAGKLNLPFRGRREDEQSMNKGVFKEFITHIAKSDIVLQNRLTTSPGNINKFHNFCIFIPTTPITNDFIDLIHKHTYIILYYLMLG